MQPIQFVQNFDDLSNQQGFQFKFYCDHCRNGYMSPFQPNQADMVGEAMRVAGNLLGGVFGRVGSESYQVEQFMRGPAHDQALQKAIQSVQGQFNQCSRCSQWRCTSVCWNEQKSLCTSCAPRFETEMAAAQADVMAQQARDKMYNTDMIQGVDVTKERTAQCPACGAFGPGGKFCQHCGQPLGGGKKSCTSCKAQIDVMANFCPECGARNG